MGSAQLIGTTVSHTRDWTGDCSDLLNAVVSQNRLWHHQLKKEPRGHFKVLWLHACLHAFNILYWHYSTTTLVTWFSGSHRPSFFLNCPRRHFSSSHESTRAWKTCCMNWEMTTAVNVLPSFAISKSNCETDVIQAQHICMQSTSIREWIGLPFMVNDRYIDRCIHTQIAYMNR